MMMSRPTPKEIFLNSASRIYCFADSVDLCAALLDAGARVIQLRNKTLDDDLFRGWQGICSRELDVMRTPF